jgi:hypothetical protein
MMHLAPDVRRQYVAQPSNDKQNALGNIVSVTKNLNTAQKGKGKLPKPRYELKENRSAKSSSSQNHLEKPATELDNEELEAIEKDLEALWKADGM